MLRVAVIPVRVHRHPLSVSRGTDLPRFGQRRLDVLFGRVSPLCDLGEHLPGYIREPSSQFLFDQQDALAAIHVAARLPAGRYPITGLTPLLKANLPSTALLLL